MRQPGAAYFDKGSVDCRAATVRWLPRRGVRPVKLAVHLAQGVEKVVEIIRPGQNCGEALMFLDSPYIVFAQALADSSAAHGKHAGAGRARAQRPGGA